MPSRAHKLLELARAQFKGPLKKPDKNLDVPIRKNSVISPSHKRAPPRLMPENNHTKCTNWIKKCQLDKKIKAKIPSKRRLSFSSEGLPESAPKRPNVCAVTQEKPDNILKESSLLHRSKDQLPISDGNNNFGVNDPNTVESNFKPDNSKHVHEFVINSLQHDPVSSPLLISHPGDSNLEDNGASAVGRNVLSEKSCNVHGAVLASVQPTPVSQTSIYYQGDNNFGENCANAVGSCLQSEKNRNVDGAVLASIQPNPVKSRPPSYPQGEDNMGENGASVVRSILQLEKNSDEHEAVFDSMQLSPLRSELLISHKEINNFAENAANAAGIDMPPESNTAQESEIGHEVQVFTVSDNGELVPEVNILPLAASSFQDDVHDELASEVLFIETAEIPATENYVINIETTPTGRGRIADRNIVPAAPLKKVKNSAAWKVNDAKRKRHLGDAYISKEGKEYAAKAMRPSCGPSCRFQCDLKVTEADRLNFKERYYTKTENQSQKWMFIWNYVASNPTRTRNEEQANGNGEDNQLDVLEGEANQSQPKKKSPRSCQNQYYMELNNKTKVKVCKEMFKNTLVISDGTISTALKKRGSPDKRGTVGVKRVVPECVIQSVHDHIKEFPKVASHYCRKDTSYEYLEQNVDSLANMYRLYVKWMDENRKDDRKATQRQYEEEANTLKIKIFKPRKDQCDVCYAYKSLPIELQEDPNKLEQQNNHILNKDLAQTLYMQDRTAFTKTQSVIVASVDLQKVLLLPHCRAGAVYYKRKLSVLNFTVKEIRGNSSQGYCYVWHEAIGKRGANEITSCLYKYMLKQIEDGVTMFRFWSDNCASQNKNRFLFGMYLCVAAKYKVKISHAYLQTGHTHNDADGIHSLIERKTSKMELFVPEDWYSVMEKVKVTGNPYIVTRMTQEDILDFHPFVDKRTNWTKAENGEKVRWSEVSELSIDGAQPWCLKIKYNHGDKDIPVQVRSKVAGHPINLNNVQFHKAYESQLPIPKKKLKDLQDLLDSNIIPHRAEPFYAQLTPGNDEDEYYAVE